MHRSSYTGVVSVDDVTTLNDEGVLERLELENSTLRQQLESVRWELAALHERVASLVTDRVVSLEAENASLAQLALTDELTGLYNVRYLRQRLPEEFARARRYGHALSMVIIDVDYFKSVNDTRDHQFGDRVLQRLALVLEQSVRSSDSVVRYGGDEFVIILPHCDLSESVQFCERLRLAVEMADLGDLDDACPITASIGVASLEYSSAEVWTELLLAADRALYQAKDGGRNRVGICRGQGAVAVVA